MNNFKMYFLFIPFRDVQGLLSVLDLFVSFAKQVLGSA